jgi:ATP-dependent Clp protease protease subunit
MQFLSCNVATFCVGQAASGAAMILAAGARGKRYAQPHSKVMVHQPWGGVSGQAADIKIQAEEILKAKRLLNELLSQHTGRSVEQIEKDSERDRFFSAKEAVEYGMADKILEAPPKDKKPDGDKN